MKLQQVLSYVRRAIDDYHMIEEGDRIAVGISGGKDSLTPAIDIMVGIMMPVVFGFILAYLLTPVLNSIEQYWEQSETPAY